MERALFGLVASRRLVLHVRVFGRSAEACSTQNVNTNQQKSAAHSSMKILVVFGFEPNQSQDKPKKRHDRPHNQTVNHRQIINHRSAHNASRKIVQVELNNCKKNKRQTDHNSTYKRVWDRIQQTKVGTISVTGNGPPNARTFVFSHQEKKQRTFLHPTLSTRSKDRAAQDQSRQQQYLRCKNTNHQIILHCFFSLPEKQRQARKQQANARKKNSKILCLLSQYASKDGSQHQRHDNRDARQHGRNDRIIKPMTNNLLKRKKQMRR